MTEEVKRLIRKIFANTKLTQEATREALEDVRDYAQEHIDALDVPSYD